MTRQPVELRVGAGVENDTRFSAVDKVTVVPARLLFGIAQSHGRDPDCTEGVTCNPDVDGSKSPMGLALSVRRYAAIIGAFALPQ